MLEEHYLHIQMDRDRKYLMEKREQCNTLSLEDRKKEVNVQYKSL